MNRRVRFVMLGGMPQRLRAPGPSSGSARLVAALTAGALSLSLAACGGLRPGPAALPDSQPVAGGARLAALWPLTGEPVSGPTPSRPVLVTKIDNTASSQPQLGLDKADLVTEELVEGGSTRLAVFFYQNLPALAGPVRSMRASDISIVKPAHAAIVTSGAAPPTLRRIKDAKIPFFIEGAPGFFRDGNRQMPYNLMVKLPKLAEKLPTLAVVPASYLPWGKQSDFTGTGTRAARTVQVVFSRSHTTSWEFRGGKYHNQNSFAAVGQQFVPDSLLVVQVREGDAGYRDPAGNHVPETIYSGKGQMLLFHQGRVLRGTWTKSSRQAPVKLSTPAGPLSVPAGHVWVELVPNNLAGGRVTFAK